MSRGHFGTSDEVSRIFTVVPWTLRHQCRNVSGPKCLRSEVSVHRYSDWKTTLIELLAFSRKKEWCTQSCIAIIPVALAAIVNCHITSRINDIFLHDLYITFKLTACTKTLQSNFRQTLWSVSGILHTNHMNPPSLNKM